MKTVLSALQAALSRGENAMLVQVISAAGSTPRAEGAKMAVLEGGMTAGTIGGGAVEHACIQMALAGLEEKTSSTQSFPLKQAEAGGLGMACGGDMDLCFCRMTPEDGHSAAALNTALSLLTLGRDAWLITSAHGDGFRLGTYDAENGLRHLDGIPMDALTPLLTDRPALQRWGFLSESLYGSLSSNARPRRDGAFLYVEPLVRAGTVYIFGGGHVARALLPVLAPLDFRAVIFEDRPEYACGGILGDFENLFASISLTERDYAVIMTRGHQSDTQVLAQVLTTGACYIGMIGSRGKIAAAYEQLRAEGFTDADLARVHSPIGLTILSDTPAEIAISIAAELIRHRALLRQNA